MHKPNFGQKCVQEEVAIQAAAAGKLEDNPDLSCKKKWRFQVYSGVVRLSNYLFNLIKKPLD